MGILRVDPSASETFSTGVFDINHASPHARNLLAVWRPTVGNRNGVIYSTVKFLPAGAATNGVRSGMPGRVGVFSDSGMIDATPGDFSTFPLTFSVWFQTTSLTAAQNLLSYSDNLGTNYWGIQIQTDGALSGYVSPTVPYRAVSAAGAIAVNKWYHASFTIRSDTDRELFINGVSVAANALSYTATSGLRIALGSWVSSGSVDDVKGAIAEARWSRLALSPGEAWSLYDPRTRWDLYREPSRRVYAPVFSKARFDDSHQIIGGPM